LLSGAAPHHASSDLLARAGEACVLETVERATATIFLRSLAFPCRTCRCRSDMRLECCVQSADLGVLVHDLDLLRCHELPSMRFWRRAISTPCVPTAAPSPSLDVCWRTAEGSSRHGRWLRPGTQSTATRAGVGRAARCVISVRMERWRYTTLMDVTSEICDAKRSRPLLRRRWECKV